MKVATILPVGYLDLIKDNDYFMCLAQFIGKNKQYTKFHQDRVAEGKFVILDNGAAEGHQPTIFELIPKIVLINPTEVILPDTILDCEDTLRKGENAIFELANAFDDAPFQIMAVPQGRNWKEWLGCLEEMMSWPIDTIGISKFMNTVMDPDIRIKAMHAVMAGNLSLEIPKQIHLLGCHNHPEEVLKIAILGKGCIRGVDSAVPYIYTLGDQTIQGTRTRPSKEIDFLQERTLNEAQETLLLDNIKQWEVFCGADLSKLYL